MKVSLFVRAGFSVAALVAINTLAVHQAMAADAAAVSAPVAQASAATTTKAVQIKPATKAGTATKAGAVIGKQGDNQYPTGTGLVPPKPKKEGLDAGVATKVNKAAQP